MLKEVMIKTESLNYTVLPHPASSSKKLLNAYIFTYRALIAIETVKIEKTTDIQVVEIGVTLWMFLF